MKLSTNLLFQFLAAAAQYGNFALGYTSGKTQAAVALIVGLAQAAVAWKAHYSNPDGSPMNQTSGPAK